MSYQGYECLRIVINEGVARVTIDHPPINLFDVKLMLEMDRLGIELATDDAIRVVVFDSADDEFFIAHADIEMIQTLPDDAPPRSDELNFFHTMVDRFRTMPKATIAEIAGRVRGGGSEFVLSLDMRFAARDRAVFAQPEVALGILPGGGGTQRLPRLVGRGRALEIILGCNDFSADLAERYGYVNRALPADELGPFVETLARRIASFPAEAIAMAKQAVASAEPPVEPGLCDEAWLFGRTLATSEAKRRMALAMKRGAQTREGEMRLGALVEDLAEHD
ncbi:MAG: enoyl-CoA hydratase/carnithine racemase [Hyphomicrobiaceae bacterium]|jgi:enoyl-CoA hydratase/carnithine racemase